MYSPIALLALPLLTATSIVDLDIAAEDLLQPVHEQRIWLEVPSENGAEAEFRPTTLRLSPQVLTF